MRLRGLSARITYPGDDREHQTPWHQHLRVISNPLPPWFSRPHCIDCLIYLDDLNEDTGAVAVVPGSHDWLDKATPNVYGPVEGEVELRVEAGGGVLIHGNLWHRGLPTLNAKTENVNLKLYADLATEVATRRRTTRRRVNPHLP